MPIMLLKVWLSLCASTNYFFLVKDTSSGHDTNQNLDPMKIAHYTEYYILIKKKCSDTASVKQEL